MQPSKNKNYTNCYTLDSKHIVSKLPCCCCCDSPAALLLSLVVQVEEVCDCSRVVPQVLHCKLRRMALTVEQMLYGVWCHSTLRTDIWYAAGNAGLVTVQKPTVTRTQLGESGTNWPRQQTFKWWDIGWWSSKDSVWYKICFCFNDCFCGGYVDSHGKYQHLWCLHMVVISVKITLVLTHCFVCKYNPYSLKYIMQVNVSEKVINHLCIMYFPSPLANVKIILNIKQSYQSITFILKDHFRFSSTFSNYIPVTP